MRLNGRKGKESDMGNKLENKAGEAHRTVGHAIYPDKFGSVTFLPPAPTDAIRARIDKDVRRALSKSPLFSEKKLFKTPIAEFKKLLKDKGIGETIKLCEWVITKNPRFSEIYKRGKKLTVDVAATGITITQLVSFSTLPDHVKGKILSETYPRLARKLKKFIS